MLKLSVIKSLAASLENLREGEDLAQLLDYPLYALEYNAKQPVYGVYHVKKANGGERLIEDPNSQLKEIQRELNAFIQAYYYLHRPGCSYGFQLAVTKEKETRNIKTNAFRHLDKPWMVNIDFKDFFHQLPATSLETLFEKHFTNWSIELIKLVVQLCTFRGRLPMGAPTSPALANFAVMSLDHDLEHYALQNGLTYTRFVDDLTFSSHHAITERLVQNVVSISKVHDIEVNPAKTQIYPPAQPKIVTGLYLTDRVGVAPAYIDELKRDIGKFGHALEVQQGVEPNENGTVNKALQQLEGRIRFLSFIEGKNAPVVQEVEQILVNALNVDRFAIVSWADFDYHKFIT